MPRLCLETAATGRLLAHFIQLIGLVSKLSNGIWTPESTTDATFGFIQHSHLPHLFNVLFQKDYAKPREATMFRRLPTAAQMRDGVKLDEDGFVVLDEHSERM